MKFLKWYNTGKSVIFNNDLTDLIILASKDRSLKMTALVHLFSDEELQRITMPVLLLIGNRKVVVKIDDVKERAERLIKKLTFRVIDGAGHTLSTSKGEIINPVIMDFLVKK